MSDLHVIFQVGGSDYAVSADEVLVMESYGGATPVPSTPSWVAGLVQIRGEVVPVVDLRVRFGLEAQARVLDQRVVVVRAGTRRVGLLVDRAREIVAIAPERFRSPPEVIASESQRFVRAVAQLGERLVMLVDSARVIEGSREERGEERESGQRNPEY